MYQDFSSNTDDAIQRIINENNRTTSSLLHELGNHLSLIKGTLQYIEIKYPQSREYKYWSQLFELIQDMENMMTDASLLNKNSTLNINKANLLQIIKGIVNNYMPQANNEQKLLSIKASSDCESALSSYPCDSDKIKHAMSNLIKNALEATSPGDFIEIMLDLTSKDTDTMLSIQIRNNGLPIPEDDIESIFLPFVTRKKGGSGIGLPLVKRIIEGHHGSIQVSSCEALTTFTVLLPLPKN